jgi:predicted nucleic-acid-binding protein
MIGLDTNILLRLWLNDDPAQNDLIDSLLAEHCSAPASLLVTDVVLVEAIWTLRSAFAQDKTAQLIAVRSLLNEIAFAFEDRDAVERAAALFEQGNCGFADALVVAKHAQRGCNFTATFDQRMRKLPGVKVLTD